MKNDIELGFDRDAAGQVRLNPAIAYTLQKEAMFAWGYAVSDGNTAVNGRTWTRKGAVRRIAAHVLIMRAAAQ